MVDGGQVIQVGTRRKTPGDPDKKRKGSSAFLHFLTFSADPARDDTQRIERKTLRK
jgi:hypothetical protein